MKLLRFCAATLISSLAFACGSSSDDGGSNNQNIDPNDDPMATGGSGGEVGGGGGEGGAPPVDLECDPDGDIPCIEGIAEPCANYDTGYDGDEFCRAEPDPSIGMQTHVGPDDYDNPDEVEPYLIYAGEETNWAEEVQSKNTEIVYTRGYRSYMRPGSHHFIMFGSERASTGGGIIENGSGTESAVGIGGRFLGGATRAIQNIDTKGTYPEDTGIGTEVAPGQWVAMNLHFINTTDHALLQEIWVNFILIDEAEVTQYVKPITWYGGLAMNVAPGEHVVLQNAPGTCTTPSDLRIGLMTAHAHASTLRVTTRMNQDTILFEDYDWHEPTEWRYRRDVTNPVPDAATATSGGLSGLVNATPADSFTWECEVQNETAGFLQFGNQVYTGEMCNVFGYFITPDRNAGNWACAFF